MGDNNNNNDPAPPAIPFALFPAEADDEIIDYTTNDGKKLYKAATTPLPTKYNGESEKFYMFLRDVTEQAQEHNWNSILMIPNDANGNRYLPEFIGELTEANIRTHATGYIAVHCRDAQRSAQMYKFLYHSLDEGLKARVTQEEPRYTITVGGHGFKSGPLFLKAITALVCVDTASNVADIHAQLHALDTYMLTKVDACNIEKFNSHVRDLRSQLANRAETIPNTALNLHIFKGYMACTDPEFATFITEIRNRVLYQNVIMTPDDLMQLALRFYSDRHRKGQWNAPDAKDEKILALTAEVKSILERNRNAKKDKKGNKGGKRGDKKKGNKKGKRKDLPKWKTTPPKEGESKTKTVKGKTLHWCPAHEQWVVHHPDECKGLGSASGNQNSDSDDRKPKKKKDNPRQQNDRKHKLKQALNSIVETSSDEEDDE